MISNHLFLLYNYYKVTNMRRKLKIIIPVTILLIIVFLTIPMFEMKTKDRLYAIRYKEDYSEFETNGCYNESYYYNEKYDISLSSFNHKKFLFFNFYYFDYVEGNVCKTEYQLEESYIENFIENATIKYNPNNIDISKLIEGKTAIVGNTKYLGNDYNISIDYILDDKHETMYIFYKYGLLIIQVGLSDEGPKFIAYK